MWYIRHVQLLTEAKEERINRHRVYIEEYCADEVGSNAQYYGGDVAVV